MASGLIGCLVDDGAEAPLAAEFEVVAAAINGDRVGHFGSFVGVEGDVTGADAGE